MVSPVDESAVLVGGPHDGKIITLPAGRAEVLFPVPQVFQMIAGPETTLAPILVDRYRLRLDRGWPARRDDGMVELEYVNSPGVW